MTFQRIEPGLSPWGDAVNDSFQDVQDQITAHVDGTDPHGDRAWAETQFMPTTSIAVDDVVSANPFYIAHRGGGGEAPELTEGAYVNSVGAGMKAVEMSFHLSADGVLFAWHDNDLNRMTNGTWTTNPELWTFAALNQRAKVVGSPLLGPGWADQTIPTAKQLFDRFLGRVVIFAEGKSNNSIPALQQLLLTYPNASESVVWKNYYTNNSFPWARNHGFKVWAYADATTTSAQLDAVEESVDYWGMPWEATDAQISAVVNRPVAKPVIVWEVHRRSEVQRLLGLGVRGIMTPQPLYLTRTTAVCTADQWFSQVKSPGEIGAAHSDPTYALKWDTGVGSNVVYAPATSGNSVSLGCFSPIVRGATGYRISFDMYWPVLPSGTLHAGLYFGAADDAKHSFGVANATGCYRMEIRPNSGAMQLYTVASGATSGVQVGSDVSTSGALSAATWYSYAIEVTATTVKLSRTDSTGWSNTFTTSAYSGDYFGIHTGSLTSTTTLPRYRNLTVTAI
jgi:glycerophosphoryl diester phosphodiesterase